MTELSNEMKTALQLLKRLAQLLPGIVILLLIYFAILYITCPVYDFNEPVPFSGNNLYNPYENMDPGSRRKANFQVQSKAWLGLTDGRKNTNEEIHRVYESLGYDVIATSDYQKINRYKSDHPAYIPVYEHGYNIRKVHQVLIGSERVLWRDYPFLQSIHNKQHIIRLLRPDNDVIVLAHPKFENGYLPENMKWLSGYDAIEVLNYFRRSFEHWDSALSSGNYVTIIGNDDVHDIANPDEVGQYMTMINAPVVDRENVVQAILSGNTYGVYVYRPVGETMDTKIEKAKRIPVLQGVSLRDDTLVVSFSDTASEVVFIGQGGIARASRTHCTEARYTIMPEDTYIRTEIHFPSKMSLYLNPVCRYEGAGPAKIQAPAVNLHKTWILRILGFATLFFILINVYAFRRRHKRRKARR